MKKYLPFILCLIGSLFTANPASGNDLTAIITVDDAPWTDYQGNPMDMETRFPGTDLTRWYAPLPVFFQGWESFPRGSIVDYRWDFGDGSPDFYGFNAAHVYENPGVYTVELAVTDTLGNTSKDIITVEVLPREGAVYYVDSEIGNDDNDGLSPTDGGGAGGPWKTADKAFSEMATDLYQPGDMVLFRRGQIFDLTVSDIVPPGWPAWGYMFGAYGEGPKPAIQYNGVDEEIVIRHYSSGLAHISFVDLEFRFDNYEGNRVGTFFFAQGGRARNILFLRVDMIDAYSNLFVFNPNETGLSSGIFLVNSSIVNTYIDPHLSSTMFGMWGSRFACLNNYFDLSGNHIAYTAIDKGVIAGNTFSRPAFGRTALRICGFTENEEWNTRFTSNNIQVSENMFHGWIDPETEGRAHNSQADRYNYLLVQFSPNGPWNQIIEHITFERNIITNGEGMLNVGAAENIILRNNIFISDNTAAPSYFINVVNANKPSKNIDIIGNTLVSRNAQYSGNIHHMSGLIRIDDNTTRIDHPFGYTNHENINIRNNIFYVYGANGFTRFIVVDNIEEIVPQVKSDYNLYYVSEGSDDGKFFQIGNAPGGTAEYFTLEEWREQQGMDLYSLFADPEFVNLMGADGVFSDYGFDAELNLSEGSAARNNGKLKRVHSFYDYNRRERYTADQSVDIGALEYTSGLSVTKYDDGVAGKYYLSQNYPNPFNPSTAISYSLEASGYVSLIIYDILGREVTVLANEEKPAGRYTAHWNGRNNNGEEAGSGLYFYQLKTGDGVVRTRKMLKIK